VLGRFLKGEGRENFEGILDSCVVLYNDLSPDEQIQFKGSAKGFIRFHGFLSAIRPFINTYWEALEFFLKLLIAKLPAPEDDDLSKGVLNAIDMDSYRTQKRQEQDIALIGNVEISPVPAQMGGMTTDPEIEKLSNIVRDFNERFGTDWTDADQVRRFLFEDLPRTVSRNPEYQSAREHSDTQNARITYEKKLVEAFQGHVFDQTELYRKFAEDPEFKKWLADTLFGLDINGGFNDLSQSTPI
jgi:type I restriction enzyme R subunit